jgi:hypothetical protein
MTNRRPRALQVSADWPTPRTHRETYAEALKAAELEFRTAQAGLDGTDASKARYAKALATYDSLQGAFPFVAAGAGDEDC